MKYYLDFSGKEIIIMSEKYLITGAAGNLGLSITAQLAARGEQIRAFVLNGDKAASHLPEGVEKIYGDVRNPKDLERFFDIPDIGSATVIHAAGIVTIYPGFSQKVWDVNVGGTENIVRMCVEKKVKKLVYVSSVHAIPPKKKGEVITEISDFDPDKVKGFYAKTKAAASKLVEEAVKQSGLDASIVFPSGLCGPGDFARGHITQLLIDCVTGKLPAGVRGGYDFSDVRDVASGVIAAAEKGGAGENYILGNRYVSVKEILTYVHEISGAKLIKHMFPLSFAKFAAPFFELHYKLKKRPPLFTRYSLYTLESNSDFSSLKAKEKLGYKTRPFYETVSDTLSWLKKECLVR